MSLQDSLFAEDVEYDVNLFLKDNRKKRVLVFPPVNNYRRYLIHQLVQDRFADFLRTFSIGQGLDRRTVVCYKTDVIREPGSNGGEHKENTTKNLSCGMGVVERRSAPKSPERIRPQQQQQHHHHHHHQQHHQQQQQQQQQQRQTEPKIVSNSKYVAPAVEIYVPPPARKARNNESRSQPRETSINFKTEDGNDNDITVLPSTSSFTNARNNNRQRRRPDRAVYVPRHRRSVEGGGEVVVVGGVCSRRNQEDNSSSQDPSRSTITTTTTTTGTSSSNSNVICEEHQEPLRQQQQQQQQERDQQLLSSKLNNVTERLTSNIIERDNTDTNDKDHHSESRVVVVNVDSSKSSSLKVKENTVEKEEVELEEEEEVEEKRQAVKLILEEVEVVEEVKEGSKVERLQGADTSSLSSDNNNKKEELTNELEEEEEEDEEEKEVILSTEESIEIFTNVQKSSSSLSSSSCEREGGRFNDKTCNTVVEKEKEEKKFVESDIVVDEGSVKMSRNVEDGGRRRRTEEEDDEEEEEEGPIKDLERDRNVENKNESNGANLIKPNNNTSLVSPDVLIISDDKMEERRPMEIVKDVQSAINNAVIAPPEKKAKKIERAKSKPAPPPSPPIKISRDECDWDSLFDDNGDCLDPSLIEELTSAVGEVMIEQPKNDYKIYSKQQVEVSSDEFAHVVEIYNFPSDFKTSDLAAVFSPFKTGGFELKWVDDTHCLGVFSSPLIAAEVLASEHPFVKTRPLSEATSLSKTKVRKSAEFLRPYRSRPETCAALARRLVTGALGVKLATARQEREHEKNVLREAKEKRRLANKQREDAWEGIIPQK